VKTSLHKHGLGVDNIVVIKHLWTVVPIVSGSS